MMKYPIGLTALILSICTTVAAAPPQKVTESATANGLTVKIQPVKKNVAAKEAPRFVVTYENQQKAGLKFLVTKGIGGTRVGHWKLSVHDAKTGAEWKLVRDPNALLPGAPDSFGPHVIAPGKSLKTTIALRGIGLMFKQKNDERRLLPPGAYRVTLAIAAKQATFAGQKGFWTGKLKVATEFRVGGK